MIPIAERSRRVSSYILSAPALSTIMFLPFLFCAFLHLHLLISFISARNDAGYPEFANVYAFINSFRSGHIYADPFQLPLDAQIYGPVFYIAGAAIARIAQGAAQEIAEIMRFAAFVSLLGAASLVGALSYNLERSKRCALISVVLAIACPWGSSMPVYATVRPDAIAVFVALAAFTLYVISEDRTKFVGLAAMLASLAVLIKQTMLCVPLTLLVDTILARNIRKDIVLLLGFIPIPAWVFAYLYFRHEHFYTSLVLNGRGLMVWQSVFPMFVRSFKFFKIGIVPVIVAVIGGILTRHELKYRPFLLFAVFSWLAGVAAYANVGANTNYLTLPWLSLLPFIPRGVAYLESSAKRSAPVCIALGLFSWVLFIHQRRMWFANVPKNLDPSGVAGITMLSDSPYLETFSAQPQLLDPFLYSNLLEAHQWDPALINQQIDREKYDLLLFAAHRASAGADLVIESYRGIPHLAPEIVEEARKHYRVKCMVAGYLALVPINKPSNIKEARLAQIFGEPCYPIGGRLTAHLWEK